MVPLRQWRTTAHLAGHARRLGRLGNSNTFSTTPCVRSSAGISEAADYCKDLVRKHDYEAFLTSQLYSQVYRPGYYALRAFYIELATVKEAVSQTTLGQGRFVFWRNAVKDIFKNAPPRHPIAIALHQVTQNSHLAQYHFQRMIYAREEELFSPTHLTVESMTAHAESTSSTFFYLILSMLRQESAIFSHAASHLGIAQSFATFLRAFPFHASKGVMVIPAEITAKHGVKQQEVFSKHATSKELEDAVFELSTIANDNMMTAREMFKETGGKVPQAVMPLFSAAIPTVSILTRLESVNFDVFHPSLQVRDWKLPWRVYTSYYNRQF
ncbi:isoprenoid synthase domain-containing protein [Pisolithus orientalis]|uniref:isoprenoid synthase domain-containing protein n=1 Tax=Pisolithus orientalis TaxID=936130 RepID=UPI00222464ED|nr:isoprenoid synthase domain-containing protein [Pisolithus orientalis]KAI6030555.1 isoprenoid synthase domain-containing protein [Pisolithus orientalis]